MLARKHNKPYFHILYIPHVCFSSYEVQFPFPSLKRTSYILDIFLRFIDIFPTIHIEHRTVYINIFDYALHNKSLKFAQKKEREWMNGHNDEKKAL